MTKAKQNHTILRDLRARLHGGFLAVGLFSLFINLLMLTAPLYMLQVYDRVLTSRSGHTLVLLTVLAIALMLTSGLLDALRARLLLRLGMRLDGTVGGALFDRVVCGRSRPAETSAGQPLRDLETLRGFLTSNAPATLFDVPWTPIFLAVILLMHPLLGLVAFFGGAVLFLLALASEFATRGPLRAANRDHMAAQAFCEGAARNGEVIEAMGMLPALRGRWLLRHCAALAAQARGGDRAGGFLATAKAIRPGLQVGMLATGAFLTIEQAITPGVMIAASIIMTRALAPLEGAIASWRNVVMARGAYARIRDCLAQQPDAVEQVSLPRPQGHVLARNLFAAPPGLDKPVVKDVSFALPAGQSLGIIGPSAAGKSTLARLLVGIWRPGAGSIRLDGAEIGPWDPVERGRHLGYLPQDVELFEGTVAENICRFGAMESEAIVAAAERAGAHDMILGLADGYETRIGAGGTALSGGQRQRIGLARALYGDPALLVLDEPNASLDAEGEAALRAALNDLKQAGVTTIVIAHRPSILQAVDKLLVLRDGQVELFGPRDEVLARIPRAVPAGAAVPAPTVDAGTNTRAGGPVPLQRQIKEAS